MTPDTGSTALTAVPPALLPADTISSATLPPANLRLPLAERARLLAAGRLNAVAWRAETNRWAAAADQVYRATTELHTLSATGHDVRVGVKDTVDVAGFSTRLGLRRYRHHPSRSAAPLRALRGASVVAKLVTPELSIGQDHGCANPLFPGIDPSGSSTGSAVAVAAHIVDVALGTDTVASVRYPAAACGVVGLRLTHDARLLDGVFPLSPLLDAPGWLARTADDLAYFWNRTGLGGLDPAPSDPLNGRRLRIGIVREALDGTLAPEIRAGLEDVRVALEKAGHTVVPVRLGDLWSHRATTYELCVRTAWDTYHTVRTQLDDQLDGSTRLALEAGADISEARYNEILAELHQTRAHMPALFTAQEVDLWLLPVDPHLPRTAGESASSASTIPHPDEPDFDQRVGFSPTASFAGLPAITFPVAVTPQPRTPVPLQAIGPSGSEALLIRFAQEVASTVGSLDVRPGRADAPDPLGRTVQ
ncbi:amidase [Streptomyces sp. NBC_00151]|uniref:amidase n=1 Tax=Streptomyces sp. NBC_00151 TaxID=2975669 RepID=UPI002DD9BC19|nr:amidase [Streptomyces sp. NBC_00151]WRZ37329.1 amidase [Streptomyces sp. NBC_00151]